MEAPGWQNELWQAILNDPDDDSPRLIYADWLDENGRSELAEFIRVQCELARALKAPKHARGLPSVEGLRDRQWDLWGEVSRRWPFDVLWGDPECHCQAWLPMAGVVNEAPPPGRSAILCIVDRGAVRCVRSGMPHKVRDFLGRILGRFPLEGLIVPGPMGTWGHYVAIRRTAKEITFAVYDLHGDLHGVERVSFDPLELPNPPWW